MNSVFRIVKTLAVILAFLIIGSVVMLTVNAGILASWMTADWSEREWVYAELEDVAEIGKIEGLEVLTVNTKSAAVRIELADKFRVATNNTHMRVVREGKKLEITEEEFNLLDDVVDTELLVTLPVKARLKDLQVETGASKAKLECLMAEQMNLKMGAGRAELKELRILDKSQVSGGAGYLLVEGGTMNNLDLDFGVGQVVLSEIKLRGESDLDMKMGRLEMKLSDELGNYNLKPKDGVGRILLNGQQFEPEKVTEGGKNLVSVGGGVGLVEVTTK